MRISLLALLLAGTLPGFGEDARHRAPVTLHDYHPFRKVDDLTKWESRREEIRTRVQLASGLLPMPQKTPLNAKRFGAVQRDGFQVERVYFESFPGHYVTGSLFTPTGESQAHAIKEGKRPAVLCPHGHWNDGRFYDLLGQRGEKAVRQQIAMGADRFEAAARNPIIARCVQLARMGCVVFAYDMLGYADSVQFEEHRRGPRAGMNTPETGKWGFVSPQATLRLQTNFGLQTWNSVRALDYLAGLEGVDPDRIGVTGASGGGTQTMIIAAIDDRIAASFPCVMPSTAMQGGCTCENTHYLRIGQGNMDIAAAVAPLPLGMTAADDWTIELETKGHPDLKALYEGLKAAKNYEAHFDIHFKHNYNHVSRTHMYGFMNRHFGLGMEEPILERDFEFLGRDDLSVWSSGEKPEGFKTGADHEREVNQVWARDSQGQWTKISREESPDPDNWVRTGWETILRAKEYGEGSVVFDLAKKEEIDEVIVLDGDIRRKSNEEVLSARIHYPKDWNGKVVIRVGGNDDFDKAEKSTLIQPALFSGSNEPTTYSGKGELAKDSWQRSPVYLYGYNDSAFVRRAHDLAATVMMAKQHPDWDVKHIRVEADEEFAAIAMAAKVIVGDAIDELSADPGSFRFESLTDVFGEHFVPGAVKYGDVDGLKMLVK